MHGRHWLIAAICCLAIVPRAAVTSAQVQALPPITASGAWAEGPLGSAGMEEGYALTPLDQLPASAPIVIPSGSALQQETGGIAEPWSWQVLPSGLLYQEYLANPRGSRLGTEFVHEQNLGWLWQGSLGGRVGLVRLGTRDPRWPEGWQLDAAGAVNLRLNLEEERDVDSADFHFGFPLTYRRGMWEATFGYDHLSSHLGDELMLRENGWQRLNYVRDSLILGVALRPMPDWRFYAETNWAVFTHDGGAEPWHFQFGVDYSPMRVTGARPDPFVAVNCQLQEESDFGGNVTTQAGLQWRNEWGRLLRVGLHYFNGKSHQYQFFQRHEEQIGMGLWHDF